MPLYARHGVPELWIVDLKGRRVHFFRAPSGGEYTEVSAVSEPGEIELAALPGVAIDLSGILSP